MTDASRTARALSFDRVVDDYERGRPSYPGEAVSWLVGGARTVVELGAGTGKLTASLVKPGREVAAVEPQHAMARRLKEVVPGAHAVCAPAEAVPIKTSWADAVVVGQAFHWFDRDRAVPEIARALKVGGHLALVWNVRDESVDWVAQLSRIGGIDNSAPTRSALELGPHFGGLEPRTFRMVQVVDRDALVAHVRSRSNVATLPEAARQKVTEAVLDLCETHPDLAGRHRFEFPYQTHAFRAQKK